MSMKIRFFLIVGVIFLFLSCTPKTIDYSKSVNPAPPVQLGAAPAAQVSEWDKLIGAAKKEGTVVIYTSAGSTLTRAMQKGIKDRYGLDLEFLPGRGEELTAKLKAERGAGLYLADLLIGGSTIPIVLMKPNGLLDTLEPLLMLPEVTDAKLWWGGGLLWLDKDRTTLAFVNWPVAPMVINTSLITTEEIKSYNDLLNPKLKGKIVIDDPTVSGIGSKNVGFMAATSMGWDFVRELAKQNPTIQRDARLAIEGLAQGKYSVYIGAKPELVQDVKRAGAPVAYVIPKEGTYLTSGSGSIAAFSKMAHPNASKLFVNWLLTKEGQTIFSQAYGVPSARLDVPTDTFDPISVPKPGVQYVRGDAENFVSTQPEAMRMAGEILGVKR